MKDKKVRATLYQEVKEKALHRTEWPLLQQIS